MEDNFSDTSLAPTFDVDILKLLLEERERHANQILAVNGKVCFIVLALVASTLVSAGRIEEAVGGSATLTMVLACVLLAAAVVLIFCANAKHYWFRMKRVRFFERTINSYLRNGRLLEALSETQPSGAPICNGNPFLILPPDTILYFHQLIFFAMICMVLGALFFIVSIL